MLPRNHLDRIQITFDDRSLVANAGLLLPATLARHLGLPELVQQRLDLGNAPGRANTGDKMMTLVASALAGGDCIDDADVLRTGATACTMGCVVKAPSTLGTFLRSFRWGHVRQLDRVSRELLARVWKAGAGLGDAPFTIDLDSTICETYGLAKEGARHHGESSLLNPGSQVILPISSGCILVYAWATEMNVITDGGTLVREQVRSLNSDYYHGTNSRYVYGRDEEVLKRSRLMSLEKSPRERSNDVKDGWFRMQYEQQIRQRQLGSQDAAPVTLSR